MRVPFQDLAAAHQRHRDELVQGFVRVLDSGRYVLGPEVEAFESEFATAVGASHAVACASGTDALALALGAYGVGPGDQVVTTAVSAFPTVTAILMRGATPIFADVNPETGLVDPAAIDALVNPATKAIIPVHLYGQAFDCEPLVRLARRQPGLRVIEDCAQGHGARRGGRHVGTFGDAGCFSFYPTKNLGAIGDGGMVVTNDEGTRDRLRRLRNYGQADRYRHVDPGWNSRLDELQAALLRVKLRDLDAEIARRRGIASGYLEGIRNPHVRPLRYDPAAEHGFHLFPVLSPARDRLMEHLGSSGIDSLIHYPIPCPRQPVLARADACPRAEEFCRTVVSIPLHPDLSAAQCASVVSAVNSFDPHR